MMPSTTEMRVAIQVINPKTGETLYGIRNHPYILNADNLDTLKWYLLECAESKHDELMKSEMTEIMEV